MRQKFETRIGKEQEKIKKENVNFNIFGTLRLISFAMIVFFAYKYVKKPINTFLYLLVLSVVLFIAFIIYHSKIRERLDFSKKIIGINERYLSRMDGSWVDFKDTGQEFVDKNHRYSSDLDIVGKRSLFQLINLTHTFYGRKIFANDLLESGYSKSEIEERQEAVKELKSKLDFCQELELKASSENIKSPQRMVGYFNEKKQAFSKTTSLFLRFVPVFTILSSLIIIALGVESLYRLVFFLFAIQALLWIVGMGKNNSILNNISYLSGNLEDYVEILKLIEEEEFKSSLLKRIKSKLFWDKASLDGIKKLQMINQRINIRSNGLLYILFNVLFLWDYQSSIALEEWKLKFGRNVENWLQSIGKIESLSSLAVPLQIEEGLTFPSINQENFAIEAKDIGHPLINKKERIYNDILIDDQIIIVTGSNMSGKTTFLRTIGINIVLTNAGAASFSSSLSLPIMDLYTSMRIVDDLKNKISTFYGELLRIKDILEYSKDHKSTFFLIDEIFRGTNSEDRIYGAKNVLRNLNNSGLMGAITTHDLELCDLANNNPRVVNYNFRENYVDGKINFDYKIRKGRSTSTNAKHLMELVGIELLE